ncbi:alpha/beta fold hydrolase [Salinimonas chungwhensis]|uniref:alpha/beta fold hydrolase n=1 Tax=Salinimonas chungwhensis TaxID=265425 RepID=UPI0009FEC93F|nr:alpha/beta fold hydrolase [Salinimonas chungwhensis]
MSISLNYEISHSHEDAPWLVLLHGLFGSLDNLAIVRRYFQNQYNVLSIDLPDHGESPHTEGFTLSDSAHGVLAIVNQLKLDSVYLLGHSLGGKVAMMAALEQPDYISALVIADIAPATYPARHESIIKGLQAVDLEKVDKRSDADTQLARHIPISGVRQFLLKSLFQDEEGRWQWRFNLNGLATNYDAIRSWPDCDLQFAKSTLFIKGGESDYLSLEHRSVIAQLFPKSKARVIDGAGHWLHAEKPDAFNRAVDQFFSRVNSD